MDMDSYPLSLSISTYTIENVKITSKGEQLAARIYRPKTAGSSNSSLPIAIILGPIGYVKEQSPKQYATRLAKLGVAAIVFDPRYFGESTGTPRQFENPDAKIEDISAVIDFVSSRPEFDQQRLSLVGICQGANWAIKAAINDSRIRRLTLISGHFLYRKFIEQFFAVFKVAGSLDERVSGGKTALEKFNENNEVDYIPIVGLADTPERLLPATSTYYFYIPWSWRDPGMAYRGLWENRITKMSEAMLWSQEIDKVVPNLHTPTLVVLGNKSATPPPAVQPLFTSIGTQDKRLVNIGDHNTHVQFYEDPEIIDRVIKEILNWVKFR